MCPEYLCLLAAISDSRIQNFRSDEFYCTFYESLACEDFDSTGDDNRDPLLLSLLLGVSGFRHPEIEAGNRF